MKRILMLLVLSLLTSLTTFEVHSATTTSKKKKTASSFVATNEKASSSSSQSSPSSSPSSVQAKSSVKDFFKGSNSFQNELLANFSMGELSIDKYCKDCDSVTSFNAQVSYLRYLQDKVQVGVETGISSASSSTSFNLAGVGAYNFDSDFKNSPFAKVGVGLFTAGGNGMKSETKFGLFIGGGKRFSILNNLAYSPEARIVKKGDMDPSFQITFLNLSVYWN